MSCSREPWLINKYLKLQLNETIVRKQDAINGLRYSLSHSTSHYYAWNFIKENWNEIINRYYKNEQTFLNV